MLYAIMYVIYITYMITTSMTKQDMRILTARRNDYDTQYPVRMKRILGKTHNATQRSNETKQRKKTVILAKIRRMTHYLSS